MVRVFLCDNQTRIHLPDTEWSLRVRARLAELGHTLTEVGLAPDLDNRDEAERARVGQLLDSTGL